MFWSIPFRWAIKVISGVRELTIAPVSVSTTIVNRIGPMMVRGNKTRAPRKRRPIQRLNLSRRGKEPWMFPSGGDTEFLGPLLRPCLAVYKFLLTLYVHRPLNFSRIGIMLVSASFEVWMHFNDKSWSLFYYSMKIVFTIGRYIIVICLSCEFPTSGPRTWDLPTVCATGFCTCISLMLTLAFMDCHGR